jgi:EAL domain-containing protein (putative c-di-GMP-specific phosphodiesterase class I)
VALDDFGTGYSSLSALSRLPVDVIKIDRTFVHRLSDPDGRAVVRAVVQLMDDLARAVVAEGIETEEQLRIARDLGCTYGQGFLLGRPADGLPAARR